MNDINLSDDEEVTLIESASEGNAQISLVQFIQDFGQGLMAAVAEQNPPIYDGNPNPQWDQLMANLKRKPFPAQRERVQAVCQLLLAADQSAAVLNGEMGCGKTMMGIAAAAVMSPYGYRRTLVIAPPHLVYKWRREILETLADAKVWVLNGPDTLRQLLKIRAQQDSIGRAQPEFFILGRVRMRMGFDWQPAIKERRVYEKIDRDPEEKGKDRYLCTDTPRVLTVVPWCSVRKMSRCLVASFAPKPNGAGRVKSVPIPCGVWFGTVKRKTGRGYSYRLVQHPNHRTQNR